ncbi:SulP family inorganic anion transporter [Roseofilum capinflatum]|uniref:SulP family inorganic anion transporter n=1 Tax=Roseofilum capinflatum BLCC-M114 TaxID=3022440 RepID=A0ABT7B7Y6_9CYAN|nr:SulP family inorganic anion transporter [Roseofilum capinflatum]MDJ1174907.1 SulP family inorganic anion transporter [Roseofilum capinflatum BLCC-M114]
MQLINQITFKNLRGDLFGGITAAIVALPLALAFGVSSGAGAIAGLYGAVCIGLLAALCGGTPSQISGPTGPMTVVMASVFTALIAKYPDTGLAMSFTVIMLGGALQILFGVLKLGQYITLIPYTVISGFMSGIGVIIILIEVGPLLGHPNSANVIEAVENFGYFFQNADPEATGLGLLTLAIVFLNPKRVNRVIPSPLLALIVCTSVSLFFPEGTQIPRIGEIPSGLPSLHFPHFRLQDLKDMVGYGLILATLGSIDSLLTSLVADNITRTEHDSDRELIGQGIGNMASGFLGGLPGAGATMRTVINVQAGGKTPLSGIIHGLVLMVILFGAGPLTATIPHTVLAGILIKVGIDIIDWSFLKRAHKLSVKATGLMYIVLFLTVFVDLITAVAVGVFVANLLTVKKLSDLQQQDVQATTGHHGNHHLPLTEWERKVLQDAQGRILLLRLGGPMSFGAAKSISQRMGMVEDYDVLILDLEDVPLLGVTASLAIENMVNETLNQRRWVFVVGATGDVKQRLQRLKLLERIPAEHQPETRGKALEQAMGLLGQLQVHEVITGSSVGERMNENINLS